MRAPPDSFVYRRCVWLFTAESVFADTGDQLTLKPVLFEFVRLSVCAVFSAAASRFINQ